MPTTLTRWPIAKAALDAIREHPQVGGGVLVAPVFPGDNAQPETIWLDEITTTLEYPGSMGPDRKPRDEFSTLPFIIRVKNNADYDATRDRLEELLSAVEDVFASLVVSIFDKVPGLLEIDAADPVSDAQDTAEGAIGFARIELVCHSRLT